MANSEAWFGWSRMEIVGRRSGLIPCGGPLSKVAAPGVLLIGDAAGWVSPMTGGGIQLAFHYGRRAASLVADHLTGRGPAPEYGLVRELPSFRAKRLLRFALDRAPPNFLVNLALTLPSVRHIAERIYFHWRGTDVDREHYLRILDAEFASRRAPANFFENSQH